MKRVLTSALGGLLFTVALPLAGLCVISAVADVLWQFGWTRYDVWFENAKFALLAIAVWPLEFFSRLFPCCLKCECEPSSSAAIIATLGFDLIAYSLLTYIIIRLRAKIKLP